MDAGSKQQLEAHLAGCAACREFASEMRVIQDGLRSLPELTLPDDVLDEVWNLTTRARRAPVRVRRWHLAAAAAAVLVMVLAGIWLRNGSAPTGPSEAELAQAAREARMVLELTSRALRRTERAVVRDVMTDEVSRALRRVPVQWPERSAAQRRGS
jgi:anti-sigma factor RsiW